MDMTNLIIMQRYKHLTEGLLTAVPDQVMLMQLEEEQVYIWNSQELLFGIVRVAHLPRR